MKLTILFALALCAAGQTPTPAPLASATLPDFIFMGISYNQLASQPISGLFSALEPESQSIGLMASESIDLMPFKYTDPATKKTGYLFTGSFRFGQHKILLNTAKVGPTFSPGFVLAIGGDAGASFSSTGTQPSQIQVGFSGSFTLSGFYRFSQHWAVGVAVRALYIAGIGPGGSGAINPVFEPGLVWCK